MDDYIFAVMVAFTFMVVLIVLGMPEAFQIINGFDFLWFGGGAIAITAGCVVITGVPCAVLEASYGVATIIGYVGLGGFLTAGTTGTIAIIKGAVLTPITMLLIIFFSKLARGVS